MSQALSHPTQENHPESLSQASNANKYFGRAATMNMWMYSLGARQKRERTGMEKKAWM